VEEIAQTLGARRAIALKLYYMHKTVALLKNQHNYSAEEGTDAATFVSAS